MTGGLLDFFTLEASEYVEQLDALVAKASAQQPNPETFGRTIRALRGSATMAKVDGIATLAEALERLARRVKDGDLAWDASSRGIAIAAIDDAKLLIRAVRSWGPDEDARVATRVAEIDRVAPKRQSVAQMRVGSVYLASAAADAAAGLLEFAEHPNSALVFSGVMDKVRALRGVAALADYPPLGEVVDAVDAAAKPLELGHEEATAERRRLFRTAARVLLEGGDAVRQGGLPSVDSVAVREFALAAAALSATVDPDAVVPISALLADGDDAVQAAPHPPTTAAQRFRLEVVSQAEHLRRLVHEGKRAADPASRERLSRDLRQAVRSLARSAQSFGAIEITNLYLAAERGAAALTPSTLDVLDRSALLLSAADAAPETMAPQFVTLSESLTQQATHATPAAAMPVVAAEPVVAEPVVAEPFAVAAPAAPATPPAPAPSPAIPAMRSSAPSGAALRDLLSTGIAGLEVLGSEHLAPPVVGEEDDVIPIEELLFRGKDALSRAIEIGDALRQAGTAPDAETLAELYDLLQLAAAE